MVELSQGRTLAPFSKIISFELDAALAAIFNPTTVAKAPPVFGRGINFACGQDETEPVTSSQASMGLVLSLLSPIEDMRKWATVRFEAQLKNITQEAEDLREIGWKLS